MKSFLKIVLGVVVSAMIIFVGFIGCVSSSINDMEEEEKKEKSCLVIQENRLDVESDEWSTEKYIRGTVKNTCDEPIDYVEIKAILFDINGNQINSDFTNITDLKAQGTWPFEICVDDDTDKYELTVTNSALE